jgi:hypothetical protein
LAPFVVLQDDGILRTALSSLEEPAIIGRVILQDHRFASRIQPEDRRRQNCAVPQPTAEISIHSYLQLDFL